MWKNRQDRQTAVNTLPPRLPWVIIDVHQKKSKQAMPIVSFFCFFLILSFLCSALD